uniref:uncharacterized protein LOC122589823 n=1 Tax=Erigeron canadensis TaxID=72917 RepID=UPI001CB92BC1|nr:uncharacterized protein LOC122589823 [Erigeron canadensis]
MEQNAPLFAKKVWKLVRVLYFMLRKGISKSKLLHDLNKMMKLGKIAGKSLHNLMFHHHHHDWATSFAAYNLSPPPGEYEFSCSNSPSTNNHHTFSLNPFHKKHHSSTYSKNKQHNGGDLDMKAVNYAAVLKAMEMIQSENSSPALPGFGRSPMVRQLRVTDSPFPLNNSVDDEDSHVVDEAAEKFINRFYKDLRRQNANATSSFGPYI